MDNTEALIVDSLSGKNLGQISLLGKPIQADELLSASGSIQSFTISSGSDYLWQAWFNQESVLLRVGNIQQKAKIITYPTDGEVQGHLDWIHGTRERYVKESQFRPSVQVRKGLALLQALLGA
jgi:hypothetical protein